MCNCSQNESSRGSRLRCVLTVLAGVLALAATVILLCRLLSGRSDDGTCPLKKLAVRLSRRADPNAADFAD